jgi:hypothetical protein
MLWCDRIVGQGILCCAPWLTTIACKDTTPGLVPVVSPRRSTDPRSIWPPAGKLPRYGLAVLSVVLAALLLYGLELLAVDDARPAVLVAVVASTLYGGVGPGALALALSALVAPDPVVVLAGAALLLLCATFRSRRWEAEQPTGPDQPAETPQRSDRFDRLEPSPPLLSQRTSPATAPPFVELTTEATWRFHHEQPLDITLPEDEQVEHLFLYSVLAECNDAFARMYGFRTAADVVGTRLVVFLPPSDPENVAYLRSFIRSGYRLEDAESHEIDRFGNPKYFMNNLVGIFERGQLVGAWGTQRDVTAAKGARPQEYSSRIHSSKSSSQ